jgi:hypothetical protein
MKEKAYRIVELAMSCKIEEQRYLHSQYESFKRSTEVRLLSNGESYQCHRINDDFLGMSSGIGCSHCEEKEIGTGVRIDLMNY